MTVEAPTSLHALHDVDKLLAEACERYQVPGASLAIRSGDDLIECATGVLNLRTGVEATPDSIFQIGSITKLFTTTLIMQLVDEGRLDLDAPVKKYLPELVLREAATAEAVTVRMLLTHTSGIDGDFFLDTGRGDDCVERYVLAMAAVPTLHEPGKMWSYCNLGFSLAGRIIEKATAMTWDAALRERLLKPAGLGSLKTRPEDVILPRAAAGHVPEREGGWRVADSWLPRSNGPAGSTPFATAQDLLHFGWMHLNGGVAENGNRLLSGASVRAMQDKQADLPGAGDPRAWGLGWMLFDWDGERVIGHDGGTIGQASFFRLAPSKRFGAAMLTNGGNTQALYRRIFGEVFRLGGSIELPPLPEGRSEVECHRENFIGTYEKLSARLEVREEDGALVAESTTLGPLQAPAMVSDLLPIDEFNLSGITRQTRFRGSLTFLEPTADGRFSYVRAGSRLLRRKP